MVGKGTFVLPAQGGELLLADEQMALAFADEFHGEAGFSAMRQESDFAPVKPRCDVLSCSEARTPRAAARPIA